ncbi:hypothetical protein conserved in bacteria [Deinococcus grandis]|uniref:Uncharacterized protein n=1 Tax=Deinococcus grandis TaxID=57498 RepID=A0A100HN65_9DEIO|nr:hypothetical protein [Deinococcus grandis]BBN96918.1 hypothetical protein DEGR_36510 [Deinococcus grandis]GAQ23799.1 hypothetical protein conserved in bacteria [Deinococcus grandis]
MTPIPAQESQRVPGPHLTRPAVDEQARKYPREGRPGRWTELLDEHRHATILTGQATLRLYEL